MARLTEPDSAKIIALTSEYATPYNAVVRDEIVMGVPRYFLERWVPVLGTDPATLVNTLRQLNYRSHHETVTISGEALAREASISRRHLYTCLETPWIAAFVRLTPGQHVQTENGKIIQQANRYAIRMDDPLAPADAEHLFSVLTNLADTPLQAAERALEMEPRTLWAPNPVGPAERFTTHRAITAQDVLRRSFPTWHSAHGKQQQAFVRLAEALHRHVTLVRADGRASKVIVPQYFRQKWWKRLGHELAWVYLWLRGCVYDNPEEGIRRDTCWVPSLNTILSLIGRPREWWRRHVEHAATQPGGWSIADFFQQIGAEKGRDPVQPQWVARQFRVALEVPIDPDDQETYTTLLNSWPEAKAAASRSQNTPDAPRPTENSAPADNPSDGVRHTETHRSSEALPQPRTPESAGSATTVHTGTDGVCHTDAQGSATSTHRNTALRQVQKQPKQSLKDNSSTKEAKPNEPEKKPAAAGEIESIPFQEQRLTDLLATVLEQRPQTPLYQSVEVTIWLEQAWPEAIRPFTPAWLEVVTGQISARDLVALILAIWADFTVRQPSRYLSWLIQHWQMLPRSNPVNHWATWCALAELPLGEWFDTGRKYWTKLASYQRRSLPFGLESLAPTVHAVNAVPDPLPARPPDLPVLPAPDAPAQNGLDERPGCGQLTVKQMWSITLAQLRGQMSAVTYTTWVLGADAVAYADGVLTVEARYAGAQDWLSRHLSQSVERILLRLAQCPITVRFTAPPDLLFFDEDEMPEAPL